MGLCADSATLHVMQLARQALPLGLKHAEESNANDEPPSIPSLMIRNVPTLYTPEELRTDLKMLGMVGGRDFDFLYLPLNAKKRRRNRGYAFLNVRTTRATALILQLHNTYLPKHGPPLRPLGICASDVQGFDANWRHFAHVFLDSSFTRSRPSEGPLFWKDGKELEARSDDVARIKREASVVYGSATSAVVSLRFCVMCGEPRRSNGRYCAECGYDLLAYCSRGAVTGAVDANIDKLKAPASNVSNTATLEHPKNLYDTPQQNSSGTLQPTPHSSVCHPSPSTTHSSVYPLDTTTKPQQQQHSLSYPYQSLASSHAWKSQDVGSYGLAVEQEQLNATRKAQQQQREQAEAVRQRQHQFQEEVRQQLRVREEEARQHARQDEERGRFGETKDLQQFSSSAEGCDDGMAEGKQKHAGVRGRDVASVGIESVEENDDASMGGSLDARSLDLSDSLGVRSTGGSLEVKPYNSLGSSLGFDGHSIVSTDTAGKARATKKKPKVQQHYVPVDSEEESGNSI